MNLRMLAGGKGLSGSARQNKAGGMRGCGGWTLVLAMLFAGWTSFLRADSPPQVLAVQIGTHKLLRMPSAIGRVSVGNQDVADVYAVNSRELLVNGKALGFTNLLVWSKKAARKPAGEPIEYRVEVSAMMPGGHDPDFSKADVQSGQALSGALPSLAAHERAVTSTTPPEKGKIADVSEVALASTQVMTQIRIAEVQKTVLNEFGINLLRVSANALGVIAPPGGISGIGTNTGGTTGTTSAGGFVQSQAGFLPIQNAFNIVGGNPSAGIAGVLSVLENKGLARVLAEPSLTAMSGQTATFLAGGEFPIPVAQSSGGGTAGNVAITIEYREFGVRLALTPTVLSSDRISLKVAPEVSELDYTNAVTISGTTVPALAVRRTDTTIELGDGQSFLISGLVSNQLINNVNKVPWIGDLPYIGAFFRNTSYNRVQKELIMVVTPHLVHPLNRGAPVPPLPGAATDNYHPSFSQTFFRETGDFGQNDSGYSH